jgi:uncharacterized protein (TIGR02588 family)
VNTLARESREPPDEDRCDDGQVAREAPPPFWEWVVAGIGLLLLVATLGYLTYYAVAVPATEPRPVIELLGVEQQQPQQFLVRIRVHNRGRTTAQALRIAGELKRDGAVVEASELEFAYLPAESSREAGLLFRLDPRTLQLELQSRSYQKP